MANVKPVLAAVIDVVCVSAFVALGIRSHGEGASFLQVAAPFLAALAVAWLVAAPLRAPESVKAGVVIWLVTLVGGMLLRRTMGDGTAATFILVATTFLAVTLIGWRGVRELLLRRKAPTTGA